MSTIKPLTAKSANNTNSVNASLSRYVGGGATETHGRYLEWWERYTFPKDPSDSVYVIENSYTNRLDLIAAVFYGDVRMAWFLAQYNNIIDPLTEIVAGRILLIPSKDRIATLLNTKRGGFESTKEPVNSILPIIS